jgi:MFS family permease
MKRSKTTGQILKGIAYSVFAVALFLLARLIFNSHAVPNASIHQEEVHKVAYIFGWYIGFYGIPVFLAIIGWILLRWGNKKVNLSQTEVQNS